MKLPHKGIIPLLWNPHLQIQMRIPEQWMKVWIVHAEEMQREFLTPHRFLHLALVV